MTTIILLIIIASLLAIGLFWIGAIFFILQKSLNEFTKGMNSLDERLSRIEANLRK